LQWAVAKESEYKWDHRRKRHFAMKVSKAST